MDDARGLKELQLDALREVANIGAGHAATALSQMTNHTIMIAVPEVNVRALEEVTDLVGRPDEVVAATGFRPGAVSPFPLERVSAVLVERTMLRHPTVWAGAGSESHLVSLAPPELVRLTRGRVEDVVLESR